MLEAVQKQTPKSPRETKKSLPIDLAVLMTVPFGEGPERSSPVGRSAPQDFALQSPVVSIGADPSVRPALFIGMPAGLLGAGGLYRQRRDA